MTEENITTTPKSLTVFWIVLGVIVISAFIPSRWFGVKPKTPERLDLKAAMEMGRLALDENKNNNPDWKDLLSETLSVPSGAFKADPEAQKKLDDPNNLTSSFSKNLLVTSAYIEQNSTTGDTEKQQLIESIVSSESDKIVVKKYTLDDLKISDNENNDSIRKYGNTVGGILKQALNYKFGDGDVEIMEAFTTNKDASVLSSLAIKKGRAQETVNQLLDVSVPRGASIYHLIAINNLSAYITTLDSMSKADIDPMRAFISFNNYSFVKRSLLTSLLDFINYFGGTSVTFSSKESGYIFSAGYNTN